MKQKEYWLFANIDAAQQQFFRKVFPTATFTNMTKSTNVILNRTTARKMRLHLKTKFNKLLPYHIEDDYAKFNKAPDPNEPIGNYFEKQNKYITLLANSVEPIIEAKRICTLSGHLQKIPSYQQAVMDYNKEVVNNLMSWGGTRLYFVHKDLEYTNNLDALSKAVIANSITPAAVVNNSIEQLQSVMSTTLVKQEQTDIAMIDIANFVHQRKKINLHHSLQRNHSRRYKSCIQKL